MDPVASSAPFMPPISASRQDQILLLFGDVTISFEADLRQLLHCRSNAVLQSFFEQIGLALRQEFDLMPYKYREWLPRFTDLVDLLENTVDIKGRPAIKSAMLCVYQIGRFIYADFYPSPDMCRIVGICTGSFAAAAVGLSRTMFELAQVGVEATLAAFRTAWQSLLLCQDIQPTHNCDLESWSFITSLSEAKAVELVQLFVEEVAMPQNLQPYISAVTPTTVSISGPPCIIDRLIERFALKAYRLPIYSPYHASHLADRSEVDRILGALGSRFSANAAAKLSLHSGASGASLPDDSNHQVLFREAILDTLCRQVRWDKICNEMASVLANEEQLKSCRVYPVASDAGSLLMLNLQHQVNVPITISGALNATIERTEAKPASGNFQDAKIAVVGFSGRYPEAASNDELWEKVLMTARDCYRTIPADRFDWEAHYDPSGKKKNHSRVKYGCFINNPGEFDARFFNLSPREAENTDPAQRLLLMSTYEAIEMAGMVPDRTASTQRDRVGVFMGTTSDDWREVNSGQDIDTYFIPGGNRAFVPGRISYFFRFSGPSISVDTACSSSFAAISTACGYLWRGDCDTAIAGGTNVLTNPDNFVGLDRGYFLSTTGNCNPFDDSAAGYCRADAVGSVILKRLDDAVADHDPIFGVIAGSSTNHCGQTVSITRPHEGDQLSLFKRILRHTNTDPTQVGYVEMHGTGTQAGDAAEMRSVLSAFAQDHGRVLPLYLGAVKANVGHAESASGVTALIKVLMMMQNNTIPPHRLDGTLNRNYPIDMAKRNVHIPFQATRWRRQDTAGGKRMAFLNNFSAAGGNTAILMEDYVAERKDQEENEDVKADPRQVFPVAVSAKSTRALTNNLLYLASYLQQNPETSLPALSYTTTARRAHYQFRVLVYGQDVTAIIAALQRRATESVKAVKPEPPKLAYVFTGQGTLYAGIGKQLFDHVDTFRADILRFARIAQEQQFPSFLPIITGEMQDVDFHSLDPVIAQLAVTCVQMALSHLWTSWVAAPSVVTGHSLGEYAALHAAGVLSASDTIFLVGTRAQLLQKSCTKSTHAMLAIKAPLDAVAVKLQNTDCSIACINSPSDVVASGPTRDIQQLKERLVSAGIDSMMLDVPYAFHSAQVETILDELLPLASVARFNEPSVPYLSPLLGKTVDQRGVLDASYLIRATRECVNFSGAIQAAEAAGIVKDSTIWVELGAHPACSGMIKKTISKDTTTISSLRKGVDTLTALMGSFESLYQAGATVQWDEFARSIQSVRKVLPIPSYRWDLKNYWIQYRNNFCLTKGDDPLPHIPATQQGQSPTPISISPAVQRVIEEHHSENQSTVLVESDIHDPQLAPIFQGHKVNGVSLCPSSLYADMAYSVADYMLKANNVSTETTGLDCSQVKVDKSLIALPGIGTQLLRLAASADWLKQSISMSIFSVDASGNKLADHGSCVVLFTQNHSWMKEWSRSAYLIQSRIDALHDTVHSGDAHKMKRGMVYKLFGSLVDYSREYQGMDEVVLDSNLLEATAKIRFQVSDNGFMTNPCWVDSLGHIAGFIMNGNDNPQFKDQVFINHGWGNMRIASRLEHGKTYTTYNRMQLLEGTTYLGNTYVLENGSIIAIFESVKFQGIPRKVLDHMLPPQGNRLKLTAPSRPATKAVSTMMKPLSTSESGARGKKPLSDIKSSQPPRNVEDSVEISDLVKAIISEEVGIDVAQAGNDDDFTDLGVDSLLALNISARLQEDLGITLTPSTLSEHHTISSFARFVSGVEASTGSQKISTPSLSSLSSDHSVDRPINADSSSDGTSTDATSVTSPEDIDVMAVIREVIVQETGAQLDDLTPSTKLNELGMDSLLSLTAMGVLGEVLDITLPPNLFVENETLHDIEKALGLGSSPPARCDSVQDQIPDPAELTASLTASSSSAKFDNSATGEDPPRASSVLLQGSPKKASKTLFLFPDGSGSATSYSSIPLISHDLAVFGLNCPWMKTPQKMKCSMEDYARTYVDEIRRRQTRGPYYLGGWSAGGIVAYEAAQQLARMGQHTARLILIDSPNPIGLQNPPSRMYDFFETLGLFGASGRKPPSWLRPHFSAFIALLDEYKIKRFCGKEELDTHIVYARDGICKHPEDPRPEIRPDDPREMLWLLNNRTDFTAAGWAELIGVDNINTKVLDEVNHFSLVGPGPTVNELSGFIANAIN